MNLERLTQKLQEGLASAQSIASQYGHPEIKPSHVLLALLNQEGGVTRPLLEKIGSGVGSLRAGLEAHLARQPPRVDAPVEACPVGGLGLQLVDQFAASLRYAREAGRNRLWIALRREA